MKLSQITSRYFVGIASVLFVLVTIISLQVVKSTFYKSIDSVLHEERNDIVFSFKHSNFSEKVDLSENVHIVHVPDHEAKPDRFFNKSILKSTKKNVECRVLESYFTNNGKTYKIEITQQVSESLSIIEFYFFISTVLMIGLVVLGTFVLNFALNKKLWSPFYHLLNQLKVFKINETKEISTQHTNIEEFESLNSIVSELIQRVKSDFVSQKEFIENTSHEFKTPLAVITHQLDELIQSPKMAEQDLEKVVKIQDSVKKLNQISKTITLLFKIENKHFDQISPQNMGEIFKSQLEELSFLGESKQINRSFFARNEIYFAMDHQLAHILVGNLVSNAFKYAIQDSFISIRVEGNVLEIMNKGEIGPNKVDELSEQLTKSISSLADSQGLGLSIVKKIADVYGINITYIVFENIHCFRLIFP